MKYFRILHRASIYTSSYKYLYLVVQVFNAKLNSSCIKWFYLTSSIIFFFFEINKPSINIYGCKCWYITYQVFMSNIPSLFTKLDISTFFFLFEINKPSANTYALKYWYITYQVFLSNISSISIKSGHINYLWRCFNLNWKRANRGGRQIGDGRWVDWYNYSKKYYISSNSTEF